MTLGKAGGSQGTAVASVHANQDAKTQNASSARKTDSSYKQGGRELFCLFVFDTGDIYLGKQK